MPGTEWFVYVVRCADGTLYTGTARDVARRIADHEAGRGARYTRGRGPLVLLAKQRCADQSHALRLELAVKAHSRAAKEELAASPPLLRALARSVKIKRVVAS